MLLKFLIKWLELNWRLRKIVVHSNPRTKGCCLEWRYEGGEQGFAITLLLDLLCLAWLRLGADILNALWIIRLLFLLWFLIKSIFSCVLSWAYVFGFDWPWAWAWPWFVRVFTLWGFFGITVFEFIKTLLKRWWWLFIFLIFGNNGELSLPELRSGSYWFTDILFFSSETTSDLLISRFLMILSTTLL